MRFWRVALTLTALMVVSGVAHTAELTEVIDAADGDDQFDLNLNVSFRSSLHRAKITHEWRTLWADPAQSHLPDYNELRYSSQTYTMDYEVEIGLFHDLELYLNLPWVIKEKKEISFVSGVSAASNSTLFRNPAPTGFTNALADANDPTNSPSSERGGIGDMQIGLMWAVFNDERDETKSVWVIGLDYLIPTGKLNKPNEVSGGSEGGVGMGHHVLTPFMLFSHRYKKMDPYIGLQGSIPIQDKRAKDNGLMLPYSGGFLTGLEIIPWENKRKHQKFAIDLRLWTTFYSEVESKGHSGEQGTVNEISDFLLASDYNQTQGLDLQLQAQSQYTQFGALLGFTFRAAEFVRLNLGVSLAHNTEHFISGAKFCDDKNDDGECTSSDILNRYRNPTYDDPGQRLRVEETTLFTYWITAMATF